MIRNATIIDGELYALIPRASERGEFRAVASVLARALLARWSRSAPSRVHDLLADTVRIDSFDPADVERGVNQLQWRLHETAGDLVLGVRQRTIGAIEMWPLGEVIPLQDLAQQEPDTEHWIEIHVEDEANAPIRDERYELRLPDGRVEQGRTDERGSIFVDGIDTAGHCRVVFPDLVLEAPVAV